MVSNLFSVSHKSVLGIVGPGGFGREVLPIALNSWAKIQNSISAGRFFFVETFPSSLEIEGIPVISEEDFLSLQCDQRFFNIAISDSQVRKTVASRLIEAGAVPFSLTASNANIAYSVELGQGAILSPYSSITANSRVGSFFHQNMYSYVAHDCVIGDYVTVGPRVSINGNVHVNDHVYIGTGAIIRQGDESEPIVVGEGAFIGMGAIVSRNVEAGATLVGYPAREVPRL